MTKYNLTLTPVEIRLIKRTITEHQLALIAECKKEEDSEKFSDLRKQISKANNTYNDISFQLSDQQNLPAPLSQREYPQ